MTRVRASIAAGIVCAAVALRAIPLFTPVIWFDEVHTFLVSGAAARRLVELAAMDAHPPLYFLLVRCVRLAAEALGPWFCTINVLRIASLVPGLLLCAAGWRIARRGADEEAGLWTAALFAVSPSLCFYSIELRNYGPAQLSLLIATMFLVRFFDGPARSRFMNAAGYALFATVSLYLQNLSVLYLLAHGLIYLDEMRREERWRGLAAWGAAAAALVGLCYAPWIPRLMEQNKFQSTATFYTVGGMDLPNTYLLFLPFGGLTPEIAPWTWAGWGLAAVSLCAALTLGWFIWRARGLGIARGDAGATTRQGGRVMRHCLIMMTVPLVLAYFLTIGDFAKAFMPVRYNMLAAPFFLVAVVRVAAFAPAGLRRFILAVFIALCVPLCILAQLGRLAYSNDAKCLEGRPAAGKFRQPGNLFWTDARMTPWLDRIGDFRFAHPEAAMAESVTPPESVWFITHKFTAAGSGHQVFQAAVLEKLLTEDSQVQQFPATGCFGWDRLWRVPREAMPGIRARRETMRNFWESQRRAIPDGQVILPDDPAFADDTGWSSVEIMADHRLWRWTLGDKQTLGWEGPEKPGRYRIELQMWRNNPYPTQELIIECHWPGEAAFNEYPAPMGSVRLTTEIVTTRPREDLELRLRIPVWIPRDHIQGSVDQRPLGLEFLSVSLVPLASTEP